MLLLIKLFINALAIIVAAYILPGIRLDTIQTVLVVAIVLSVINSFLKPIILLFTLPITLLTLGLFSFVINALLVLLTSYLVHGFSVENFWWALLFSIVVGIVSSFLNRFAK